MLNNHVTSKAGIAKELNLSMPTVLANVNDLLEKRVWKKQGNMLQPVEGRQKV